MTYTPLLAQSPSTRNPSTFIHLSPRASIPFRKSGNIIRNRYNCDLHPTSASSPWNLFALSLSPLAIFISSIKQWAIQGSGICLLNHCVGHMGYWQLPKHCLQPYRDECILKLLSCEIPLICPNSKQYLDTLSESQLLGFSSFSPTSYYVSMF